MWLSRPVYESLPYLYAVIGAGLMIGSFFITEDSALWLLLGVIGLVAGLVIWLRRRDYRTMQSEYEQNKLD